MSRKDRRRRRKARQKERMYSQVNRENAQLAGEIPTTPAGALRPEAVDPATQQEGGLAELPKLVVQAVRGGWATPEEAKRRHVETLGGLIDDRDQKGSVRVAAFNALRQADKDQWERDHPEEVAKARGGTKVAVGVAVNGGQADVFGDIARDVKLIAGTVDGAAGGDVQANGVAEPLDAAQPGDAEEEREATRVPDGDAP